MKRNGLSATQTPITDVTTDTIYTLSCTDGTNNYSASVNVTLVPSYQEI